ncbi:MAG: FAD-dependent oxidoreductase, partial [Chloroflexota bacterium]|nr:FAD-dependent oxidoreductase [Chloroflexota bacterium]
MHKIEGIVVAGGGAVGLMTALRIAQQGVSVTVFESAPNLV